MPRPQNNSHNEGSKQDTRPDPVCFYMPLMSHFSQLDFIAEKEKVWEDSRFSCSAGVGVLAAGEPPAPTLHNKYKKKKGRKAAINLGALAMFEGSGTGRRRNGRKREAWRLHRRTMSSCPRRQQTRCPKIAQGLSLQTFGWDRRRGWSNLRINLPFVACFRTILKDHGEKRCGSLRRRSQGI